MVIFVIYCHSIMLIGILALAGVTLLLLLLLLLSLLSHAMFSN